MNDFHILFLPKLNKNNLIDFTIFYSPITLINILFHVFMKPVVENLFILLCKIL